MSLRSATIAALLLSTLSVTACGGAEGTTSSDPADLDSETASSQQGLAMDSTTLWPANSAGLTVIPVCFTNRTDLRANVREVIEASWEAIGSSVIGPFGRYGVDFTGWGTCSGAAGNRIPITFTDDEPNHTEGVGKAITRMTLHTNASDAIIIHEFGHALGFRHEFNRADYEDVDPDCTASQGLAPDYAVTGVDTGSIMNYASCGGTNQLTLADMAGFANLYGPWGVVPNQRFAIRHDTTQNYVRADSVPDVTSPLIRDEREIRLEIVVGGANGKVNHGDTVRLRTFDNQFLRANGSNGLLTKTTATGSYTHWVIAGTATTGTPVRVNDRVTFWSQHSLGRIRQDASGRLITTAGADYFRMIGVGAALDMQ